MTASQRSRQCKHMTALQITLEQVSLAREQSDYGLVRVRPQQGTVGSSLLADLASARGAAAS